MAHLHLNPYLNFPGNTAEAMEFYHNCIAGSKLEIQLIKDSPMKDQMPPEAHNNVLHSTLMLEDGTVLFMAADSMMGQPLVNGNSNSLCLAGELAGIQDAFEKLSDGATITYPLRTEFFGTIGQLVDKYGMSWMVQSDEK